MKELQWAWTADSPAPKAELERLNEVAPLELPKSYVTLLSSANGYEAPLSIQPLWLVLYPAQEVIETAQSDSFSQDFPGLFVIGGNGGGEAIALDARPDREGMVVSFDMTNINIAESVWDVAENFDELLSKVEG